LAVAAVLLLPIPIVFLLWCGWNCATGNAFKEDEDYKPDLLHRTFSPPIRRIALAANLVAAVISAVVFGLGATLAYLALLGICLLIFLGIAGLLWFGVKQLF